MLKQQIDVMRQIGIKLKLARNGGLPRKSIGGRGSHGVQAPGAVCIGGRRGHRRSNRGGQRGGGGRGRRQKEVEKEEDEGDRDDSIIDDEVVEEAASTSEEEEEFSIESTSDDDAEEGEVDLSSSSGGDERGQEGGAQPLGSRRTVVATARSAARAQQGSSGTEAAAKDALEGCVGGQRQQHAGRRPVGRPRSSGKWGARAARPVQLPAMKPVLAAGAGKDACTVCGDDESADGCAHGQCGGASPPATPRPPPAPGPLPMPRPFRAPPHRSNAILLCEGPGCSVAVHQLCYGLDAVPEGEWRCDACAHGLPPAAANCCCCPVVGGAVRRAESLGPVAPAGAADGAAPHVHLACALWTPEVGSTPRAAPAGTPARWPWLPSACPPPHPLPTLTHTHSTAQHSAAPLPPSANGPLVPPPGHRSQFPMRSAWTAWCWTAYPEAACAWPASTAARAARWCSAGAPRRRRRSRSLPRPPSTPSIARLLPSPLGPPAALPAASS